MDRLQERYLGDGVYVEFDGYHIVLKTNNPNNPTDIVYLDHHTALELIRYIEDMWDVRRESEQ